ncbi:hypothetical protein HOL59_03460 [Candidatus Woesearchaeota archaeon]|jgi:hypothetical protein|nr:hypothetical protein [Candidatus Woesearchaeota archaeon]
MLDFILDVGEEMTVHQRYLTKTRVKYDGLSENGDTIKLTVTQSGLFKRTTKTEEEFPVEKDGSFDVRPVSSPNRYLRVIEVSPKSIDFYLKPAFYR